MAMEEDVELLRRYVRGEDQAAFEALVRRHADWVYSAAKRQVEDGHLAEDVTQAVFLLLARKASRVCQYAYLHGWLFQTVHWCVKEAKRARMRQQRREREAAAMREERIAEAQWDEIGPVLDDAVRSLPTKERDAVLLRFYQQMSLAQVGQVLGISEEAAKKRVQRALERLRGVMANKGVVAGVAGLGMVIGEHATEAAPAQVVAGTMAGVKGGSVGAAGALAKGTMIMMTWAKAVQALAACVVAGTVVAVTAQTGVFSKTPAAATMPAVSAPAARPVAIRKVAFPAEGLPKVIPSNRLALRLLDPNGDPMWVDDIREIFVWIESDSRWLMGPKPEVLGRFADGWVYVDRSMVALATPGKKVEMTCRVLSGSSVMVSTVFPNDRSAKLSFVANSEEQWLGVDNTAGPTDVRADEVAGQVIDAQGNPMAGATVSLPRVVGTPESSPQFLKAFKDYRSAVTTGADGVFRFGDFANNPWYLVLQVDKAGYATRWLGNMPVGRGFVVRMDNTTWFRGELRLPDGRPAADATIELATSRATDRMRMYSPMGELVLTTKADAQGHYAIAVEPGEYDVRIWSAGGVLRVEHQPIRRGETVAFPAQLETGVSLRMQLIDSVSKEPIPGMSVWAREERLGCTFPRANSERKTDAQGMVQWEGQVPGKASFQVVGEGYVRWWNAAETDKYERGIDGIRLKLYRGMPDVKIYAEPGMRVTGQVLDPDRNPVADARIDIAGLTTGDARYARQADKQGRFSLTFPRIPKPATSQPSGWSWKSVLKPAPYAIVAHDAKGRWANANSERFAIVPGEKKDLTLQMTVGGTVKGRVVDRNGQPVARIEVEARAADGMDREYYNPRTLTDEKGRFELKAMRAATYSVQPDIEFGVNIMQEPKQKTREADVQEGQVVELGDLPYDGPPVPAIPEYYQRELEMRKEGGTATTQRSGTP